jgi:hypothetical protein
MPIVSVPMVSIPMSFVTFVMPIAVPISTMAFADHTPGTGKQSKDGQKAKESFHPNSHKQTFHSAFLATMG